MGGGQLATAKTAGEGGAQCRLVSVSCLKFQCCDNSAEILATARVAYLRLICSVWPDEWIRILCNDYFLAMVISYTDYFEVIVTLDRLTNIRPSLVSHGVISTQVV